MPEPSNSTSNDDNMKVATNGEVKRKKHARALEQLIASIDPTPPDYAMPGYKDRLLTPLHILPKENKVRSHIALKDDSSDTVQPLFRDTILQVSLDRQAL